MHLQKAGKTTFLNAVLGKTSGYKKDGLVLINGKSGSMQSYKKIIGFVPQDDIIHGNLTVEENLWFSACCRVNSPLMWMLIQWKRHFLICSKKDKGRWDTGWRSNTSMAYPRTKLEQLHRWPLWLTRSGNNSWTCGLPQSTREDVLKPKMLVSKFSTTRWQDLGAMSLNAMSW